MDFCREKIAVVMQCGDTMQTVSSPKIGIMIFTLCIIMANNTKHAVIVLITKCAKLMSSHSVADCNGAL